MKITDILRAEHTVFHHLFDQIESVAPKLKTLAEVKSLATLAYKVMSPHSRTEDELFIEPLEHCFEQIGQLETFHDEHEIIELLAVSDTAVCTSGDYERRSPADGGHHILDPRTGEPAAELSSVTVLAASAMVADALATAAFVLGPVQGLALLERHAVRALMVTPSLERFATAGMRP